MIVTAIPATSLFGTSTISVTASNQFGTSTKSFLLTVADSRGLSYYSDASIGRYLRLDSVALSAARAQLIAADLVAHRVRDGEPGHAGVGDGL